MSSEVQERSLAAQVAWKIRNGGNKRIVEIARHLALPAFRAKPQGDTLHLRYAGVTHRVLDLAEQLQPVKELANFYLQMQADRKKYELCYPPLTVSYYNAHAFFDMAIDGETLGDVCLELMREFQAHPDSCQLLQNLCQSQMAIYVHEGLKSKRVQLRDLATDQLHVADVPSGYLGAEGEIWFTRVLPSLSERSASVILTTPYILCSPDLDEWREYLKRKTEEAGLEFVREAYYNHSDSAILLAGLPDRPETRPHSTSFEEDTLDVEIDERLRKALKRPS